MAVTAQQLEERLKEHLQATHVDVTDTSGGCGASFALEVVSPSFEGAQRSLVCVPAPALRRRHSRPLRFQPCRSTSLYKHLCRQRSPQLRVSAWARRACLCNSMRDHYTDLKATDHAPTITHALVPAGLKLIQRHRKINEVLKEEIAQIHALQIVKCQTPEQHQQ